MLGAPGPGPPSSSFSFHRKHKQKGQDLRTSVCGREGGEEGDEGLEALSLQRGGVIRQECPRAVATGVHCVGWGGDRGEGGRRALCLLYLRTF